MLFAFEIITEKQEQFVSCRGNPLWLPFEICRLKQGRHTHRALRRGLPLRIHISC